MKFDELDKLPHGADVFLKGLHGTIARPGYGDIWEIRWDNGCVSNRIMFTNSTPHWMVDITVATTPDTKVEITVSLPPEWEATGEFRVPMREDCYIGTSNLADGKPHIVEPSACNNLPKGPRLIVRRKYTWQAPEWLNPGFVYSNNGKDWLWMPCRPVEYEGVAWSLAGASELNKPFLKKFDPPKFTGWRTSVYEVKAKT